MNLPYVGFYGQYGEFDYFDNFSMTVTPEPASLALLGLGSLLLRRQKP
jgi:hypothetical protein